MEVILSLVKMEGIDNIRSIIDEFKKQIDLSVDEIENENDVKELKKKVHVLKGFFRDKKIVKLLDKIKYEDNHDKIKKLFKKAKILIYKRMEIFN